MTDPRGARRRSTGAAVGTLVASALVCALATGCDSGSSGAGSGAPKAGAGPSVVAPGKPGEKARTLSPQDARKAGSAGTEPNSADFRYVRMMIPHHQQALVMTGLAEKHAEDGKVRKLAKRIAAAQQPEIGAMRGWLERNSKGSGGNGPEDGGDHTDGHAGHGQKHEKENEQEHEHDAMPGMATETQLEELREARGADFDALFLKLMTTHHRGAVKMAGTLLANGNDVLVEEMANDVVAQQSAEIERMRKLR